MQHTEIYLLFIFFYLFTFYVSRKTSWLRDSCQKKWDYDAISPCTTFTASHQSFCSFTNHALKKGSVTPTCQSLAGLFIHYLDKYGLSGFQYDFNTSYSTTDLLTVEDEIIVSTLNMSVVSRMSNLISQKLFTEFFYWYFFSNLTSVEYFARFLDLFLCF